MENRPAQKKQTANAFGNRAKSYLSSKIHREGDDLDTLDNWSRGSAYSILLLTISVVFVLLMMKIFKVKIGEIVR